MTVETTETSSEHGALFEPLPFSAEDVRHEINRRRGYRGGRVFLAVLAVIIAALAIAVVVMFNVTHSLKTVQSATMEPTLSQGQVVYVQDPQDIQAGDVVVIKQLSGGDIFTRIMACPGEWVGVTDNNQLAVSDKEITKGALLERGDSSGTITLALQLPESTYIGASDDTAISEDLLLSSQSYIVTEQIVNKVLFKVWPPFDIGSM